MGKIKKRIMNIIGIILIITIVALLFYMEWDKRTGDKKETSQQNISDIEALLSRDLEQDYPKTPRDVLDYSSLITKALYSGAKDDEVTALANQIRELYDEEFLEMNPEEQYQKTLYTEIAAWNQEKRTITNHLFVNEDQEIVENIEGRDYATLYVSYTIQQKGKTTEVRKYLLRMNKEGRWKILGWEAVSGIVNSEE